MLNASERLVRSSRVAANGCVLWTGALNRDGYGKLQWQKKHTYAHRLAWVIAKGLIPSATPLVLHKCDVPSCINPDHLFLGTQAQNITDMRAKGRAASTAGEKNANCRLSAADVLAIRADARGQAEIADNYGIHRGTVSKIKLRQRRA